MTWAIVPVKRPKDAKRRLAPTLAPDERQRLVLAMFDDVLDALAATKGVARRLIVTPDPDIAAAARTQGVDVLIEEAPRGLNAAVRRGIAAALAGGAERVLVVPADVPLVKPAEIEAVLAEAPGRGVVLAESWDGRGTNGLLLCPPDVVSPCFGARSIARHRGAARRAGVEARVLRLEGLQRDIDRPEHLAWLAGRDRYGFLPGSVSAPVAADWRRTLKMVESGRRPTRAEALALAACDDLAALTALAEALALEGHGVNVSFSKKVFIPLTKLCRDVCHYCTFARPPRAGEPAYLAREEVLAIARAGAAAGCKEALFTLGDKPELRYAVARAALAGFGHETTLSYLEECARLVFAETGLLPHLNPGVMDEAWLARLRAVSVSQGIMLETVADRLSHRGGPHFGSPDKEPRVRLATIAAAGRAGVPFTTGILIGIGETRAERIEALLALRDLHARYGHIQEIIVQNFRRKPGTRMAAASEPSLAEHVWTVAVARLIFGPAMNIQAPPNLRPDALAQLVHAGINDWGGVSPVTPDHVNPEAPWPHLDDLARATERAGRVLVERLAIYPAFAQEPERWLAEGLRTPVRRLIDSEGFARLDGWAAGSASPLPPAVVAGVRTRDARPTSGVERILARADAGEALGEDDIVRLFAARGADFSAVCAAADRRRRIRVGDTVTYVVNRNINYTNICTYGCRFCAFSKNRRSPAHGDKPYDLPLDEIARRTREAWARGATEVCLQGGIAPRYTGETYVAIVAAVKAAAPGIHVHAFSPLEVWHGAETLGLPLTAYLERLRAAGLASLPGTAAEILDDEVRAVLCPDKIDTAQWFQVMEAAHEIGLRSTATIMFGHVDAPCHWARHLLRVRALQARTGGFTEFVPLPFVHMEAPIYRRGQARQGSTMREAVLMHAVARLVLDPLIANIQTSWVKMGPEGAALCLKAGANDFGGVLMNESITRAAGAVHGQEMTPIDLERRIRGLGRVPRQRTTLYGTPPIERIAASFGDCEVRPMSLMAAE